MTFFQEKGHREKTHTCSSPKTEPLTNPITTFGTHMFTRGDALVKSGINATKKTIDKVNESGLAASIQAKYDLGGSSYRTYILSMLYY